MADGEKKTRWQRLQQWCSRKLRGRGTYTASSASNGSVLGTAGGVAGGLVAVGGNVQGDVLVGADALELWERISKKRPPTLAIHNATQRYLNHILDVYRYLDFKGMGVSDRVPLKLPLVHMYVPLHVRIEMPRGETWSRDTDATVEQQPDTAVSRLGTDTSSLSSLILKNDCVIVLGDPGSGKTTFLKYVALQCASRGFNELGLGAKLPIPVPLSAYAAALARESISFKRFVET